jgi:hypothetical protein
MSLQGAITGGISGAMYGGMGWGWVGAIVGFVIGAVVGGLLGLLNQPPDVKLPGAPDVQALSITSNIIGEPVIDVLGSAKVVGTLLFFGGERAVPILQKVQEGK